MTTRLRPALVSLFILAALAASPARAPDTDELVRQAGEALRQKDYARAAALFEEAEPYATDPGLVAFNLATAKYSLALQDANPQALADAEMLYRCCTGPGDPRRARALYGLGNCLLLRASGGPNPDAPTLRAAVKAYRECLAEKQPADPTLVADARHNLQRARLLLAQVAPSAEDPPEEDPPPEDRNPRPDRPDRSPPDLPGTRDFGGDPDSLRGATPVKPQPGDNPIPTDAPPAPGPGSLAPIPDSPEPAAIPPGDAVEYLRRATRAILDERRDHRRERGKPASPGARGW